MKKFKKVYAVDFDGTLAHWDGVWKNDPTEFGDPIYLMVDRVRKWLEDGIEVWVFTARLDPDRVPLDTLVEVHEAIGDWTETHIGTRLKATAIKKVEFFAFFDDRAYHVESNVGEIHEPEAYSGSDYYDGREQGQGLREFVEEERWGRSVHDDEPKVGPD